MHVIQSEQIGAGAIELAPRFERSDYLTPIGDDTQVSLLQRRWDDRRLFVGIGVDEHPNARTHPGVPYILELASQFDEATRDQKRILVFEGGTPDVDPTLDPLDVLDAHPNRDAAMMIVWAAQHDIQAVSGEVDDDVRAQQLLDLGYSREEVLLCSVMRVTTAWATQDPSKRLPFWDHIQRYALDRYSISYGWEDFDFSRDAISSAYVGIYGRPLTPGEAASCHDQVIQPVLVELPLEHRSRMQQLTLDDNDNRDRNYAQLFRELTDQGYSVLTELGATHLRAIARYVATM
jgi:hypothetical protein